MYVRRECSGAIALISHAHLSLRCPAKYANTMRGSRKFYHGDPTLTRFFLFFSFLVNKERRMDQTNI